MTAAMKVLVYGNCQARPIGHFLKHASSIPIEIIDVAAVHTLDRAAPHPVYEKFKAADGILTQPVGHGFGELSTDSLRQENADKDWTTFPSIYFGGPFPYLFYPRGPVGTLPGPLKEYHDKRIVRDFINGLSEADCLENLQVPDRKFCDNHYDAAVAESYRREEGLDIKVMDEVFRQIAENRRTFWTFNHPTNLVLWHIVVEYLRLHNIPLRDGAAPWQTQNLANVRAAIVPEVIEREGLSQAENVYAIDGKTIPFEEVISQSYELYRNNPEFTRMWREDRSE